jgi:hypothetical protein
MGEETVGLTVINKATGEKVGIITYLSIAPAHRRIEIGGLWYSWRHDTHARGQHAARARCCGGKTLLTLGDSGVRPSTSERTSTLRRATWRSSTPLSTSAIAASNGSVVQHATHNTQRTRHATRSELR